MKFLNKVFISSSMLVLMLASCDKGFFEKFPPGTLNESTLATEEGVNKLLIGAYSRIGKGNTWHTGMYIYGGIASDDAHTGTTAAALPDLSSFEKYTINPNNDKLNEMWEQIYRDVQRSNDVLRILKKIPSNEISEERATQIKGEAVFLRSVSLLKAAMIWGNVPYVDEEVSFENDNFKVPNNVPIWDKLEEDFKFAADNLTSTKSDAGRANKWAAKAFLVKVLLFEHKFKEAQPILEDIIANGVTASGEKYALCNKYWDNFDPREKNNSESVFAIQFSVNDGANGANGNSQNGLGMSGPYPGPFLNYGFYQPSFSLVNSFKTDPNTGLPLIYTFNNSDIKNDQGISSSDPFIPYQETLDSRLDWTVGRRGIPYLDWGVNPGMNWVRHQSDAGPYLNIKGIAPQAAPQFIEGISKGVNEVLIRYAEVLLWAAEVEVEVGSLDKAQEYVNMVRKRAANPLGWVHTYKDPDNPLEGTTSTPAANYNVGLYPKGYFTMKGKDFARDAVHFEEKLECGMEGKRFFELQRWDNGSGSMANVLNAYLTHEAHVQNYYPDYMKGAHFEKGKNEIQPIPQIQIDKSSTAEGPTLTQNPGY